MVDEKPPGLDLLLEIDAGRGKGLAVEDALRSAIREGRLEVGTRLPSARGLAEELGLSRGTIGKVYEQLSAEGWLVTSRGRLGTRVAERAVVRQPAPPAYDIAPPQPRHDLSPGRPDVSAFPRQAWLRSMHRVLRDVPVDAFGYGDPRGRTELRTALAAYLGRVRGVRVNPAHIVICSGYTQALGLLATVFAQTGVRSVGMENPSLGDHAAVLSARVPVADIPVDAEGLSVAALVASGADAVVGTLAHQFPLGVSMTAARRARLLEWARERRAWIVEDDYDGEFRYDRRPVGALQARDPARIVYIGSTSKTLGPAVRLGWICCPPPLLEALVEAKRLADRITGPLDQIALADLITSGAYDRYLRAMRQTYRRRRDTLADAVASTLPQARVTGISAGLHVILELPRSAPPEHDVVAALRTTSVRLQPLAAYERTPGDRLHPCLVIGYATPSNSAYAPALTALLDTLRTL
jgi:GntR family transcriptional regulator / MocR family aminotransferase